MLWLLLISAGGLVAGVLLLRPIPLVAQKLDRTERPSSLSIIIPARDEEENIGSLLQSICISTTLPDEVVVVDDGSEDSTAAVAKRYGSRVLSLSGPPSGWTGKTWACSEGARAAAGQVLAFLDADTRLVDGGLGRIASHFSGLQPDSALSILPFHRMVCWYEELSLFFNILMAVGAGGFGSFGKAQLFGQSLLLSQDLYWRAGGHGSVRGEILENLHFAACIHKAGGTTHTVGGLGVLEVRMFPRGLSQLRASWRKAFASGAGTTHPLALALSVYWLTGAMLAFLLLLISRGQFRASSAALYLLFVIQIGRYARQVGTFRWVSAVLYPLPLVYYFIVFGESVWLQLLQRPIIWRGRRL